MAVKIQISMMCVLITHRVTVGHVERLDQKERREIRENREHRVLKGEMDSLEYLSVDSRIP